MNRGRLTMLLLIVCLIGAGLTGYVPAAAQSSERTVTARADCFEASGADDAAVEVLITNDAGAPIAVSYVHGFTTGQAFNPRFAMVDPGPPRTVTVEDGERLRIAAPWDDLREAGEVGGALIVTSAGLLLALCDDRESGLVRPLGPAPRNGVQAAEELATVTAETIGGLEMWRAYPALYALLHPDARELVPFKTVACWYADQYGLPDDWKETAYTTTVLDVTLGSWTWSVNGEEYINAATVTYEREVGAMASSDTVEASMHLAPEDGQYRWFFGDSLASLDALPTDCDLGN